MKKIILCTSLIFATTLSNNEIEKLQKNVSKKEETIINKTENTTIEVQNNIKPDMLTFKNFFYGTFKPKELTKEKDTKLIEVQVRVNDKIIKPNEKITIDSKDGTIKARYDYNFMVRKKGKLVSKRKGAKEVTFNVEPNTKKLNMTFSWDDNHRVVFDKASPDPKSVQKKEPHL